MAQQVNIVLIDDLDESEADETVTFGLDGVTYEIDLTDAHAEELREALALFVAHGRKVSGRRTTGRRTSAKAAAAPTRASAADVRAWARENGWEVSDRGRVPSEVREAYAAAN